MEASTSTMHQNEDKALKSLLESFGSMFSLEDIASAFCKAGRDVDLAGELLCGRRTSSSSTTAHNSNGFVTSETPLKFANDNEFSKALRLKNNSILGKNYVWRPRRNTSPNETKPVGSPGDSLSGRDAESSSNKDSESFLFERLGELSLKCSTDNEYSKSCEANGNGYSKALRLKNNPILGKNYVWRPRRNTSPNGTKPVYSPQDSLSGRDADSNPNKDLESFLFEMLGQGFKLERSAIKEVLGRHGYDMKKSLETLLDLTAATLDQRNYYHEGCNLNSNSETLSSQNQVQKQKIAESGSRTMRTNGILPGQLNERYERKKEVMTALFHVPERPDLTVSAPVLESVGRSSAFGTVATEPLKDIDENHKANATSCHLESMKDEAEEDDYQILRKAVREYRDTMKEYYKAAAEAFAVGDHARAGILMEKGQFFYNKAREADEESTRKIFETSGGGDEEMQDEMCLDLQHHDAKEAIRLLKSHLRSLCGIPSIKNLKIIVGISEQDAEKRKRLVIKLLEKEAIKWTEEEKLGTILIRLDKINPKRLSFARKY